MMKLRIRSVASRETIRLEIPHTATLFDLKSLLASKISVSSSSSPSPPPAESIRLSLNRTDDLSDPTAALSTIGLTSGDLLFYSLHPLSNPNETLAPIASPEVHMADIKMEDTETVEKEPISSHYFFVARLLKQVIDAEDAKNEGCFARFVVAVHAAFLDAGFVVVHNTHAGSRRRLPPQGLASLVSSALSVKYTIPELVNHMVDDDMENGKFVTLNYSVLGNFMTIYGHLSKDVYRVCLDSSRFALPLLLLDETCAERVQQQEILELWTEVKDRLCLPLMIDLCQKNGLPLPPCFMGLSADLKAKILESVGGVDLAKVQCTCSELKTIASDDMLWKNKFHKECKIEGESSVLGRSWKERFARACAAKKAANKAPRLTNPRLYNFGGRYSPVSPYQFPMVGGDYDRFPVIGNLTSQGPRFGNQRRNISPMCNLGGPSFMR